MHAGTTVTGNTLGLIYGNLAVAYWEADNVERAIKSLGECLRSAFVLVSAPLTVAALTPATAAARR